MDVSKYYNKDFRKFSDQYIFGYVQGFYFPDNPNPGDNEEFGFGFKDGAYDKKNNIWKYGLTESLGTSGVTLSYIKSYVRGFLNPHNVPLSNDDDSVNGYKAGEKARKEYVTIDTEKSPVYDFNHSQSIDNTYLLGYLQGILYKDDKKFELGADNIDFNDGFIDGRYDAKNNSLRYMFKDFDFSIFETKNLEYKQGFINGFLNPTKEITEFGDKNFTKNYKDSYNLGRSFANGEKIQKDTDMNKNNGSADTGFSARPGEGLDPELCAVCMNSANLDLSPVYNGKVLTGYSINLMENNQEGCQYVVTSKIGEVTGDVVFYSVDLAGQSDTLTISMGTKTKTVTIDIPKNVQNSDNTKDTTTTDTNTDTSATVDNSKGLTLQMALDSGYTLEQLEKMGLYNPNLQGRGILGSIVDFLGLDVLFDMVGDFLKKNWNFMNEGQKYASMVRAFNEAVARLDNNIKVRNGIYYSEMSKLLNYFIVYGKAVKLRSSNSGSIRAQRRFIAFAEAKYNAFLASLPAGLEYRVVPIDYSEMQVPGLLYRGFNESQKQILRATYVQYEGDIYDINRGHSVGFRFPMWLMFIPIVYLLFFADDNKKRKRGKKYGKRIKR